MAKAITGKLLLLYTDLERESLIIKKLQIYLHRNTEMKVHSHKK